MYMYVFIDDIMKERKKKKEGGGGLKKNTYLGAHDEPHKEADGREERS